VSGVVICVIVPDPNGRVSSAWTRKGKVSGYEVMFREEARAYSQPVKWKPEKVWTKSDDNGLLTPTLGDG
jgi:hypothetical protein